MPSTNALTSALSKRQPEAFGRYHLLGRIAVGGMAEVYVARCGELVGMQTLIAVKRILPFHAADEKFVQMFQREASIALRLQHRSIARVFEVGKVNEDWFLSMELVQGENMARVTSALEERNLRWDPYLIAFIGAEIAQALHYAHSLKDARSRDLKIVHRDVSPENIMLGYDGSVRIIDFGIALCESYASLTTQGAVRGKVQYVSPEQAQTQKLDGRSDVFSLGVVLYECLAGAQPFEHTSPMATLDAVVNMLVPDIPHVPKPINDAIIKALAKDPEQRYQSADEFAQALLAAISGQTVVPDKVSQLVSSLFPKRLARWREIQEIAGQGFGFKEQNSNTAQLPVIPPPPAFEGAESEKSTKIEKYYVVSDDHTEPISMEEPPKPKTGRRMFLSAAAGAAVAIGAVALYNKLKGDDGAGGATTRDRAGDSAGQPATAPTGSTPRVQALKDEPSVTPLPGGENKNPSATDDVETPPVEEPLPPRAEEESAAAAEQPAKPLSKRERRREARAKARARRRRAARTR